MLIKTYLNKCSCNTSKTTLAAQTLRLGFLDNCLCVLGLRSCQAGEGSAATTSATAAIALLGDVAGTSGLDVVVGDVAAVGSLVPDVVSVDISAVGLTGDGNVESFLVALDNRVGGTRTRATVHTVAGDGVGADQRCDGSEGKSQQGSEHHSE